MSGAYEPEEYEKILYDWVTKAVPSRECIYARQPQVRPAGDYFTLQTIAMVATERHFPESVIQDVTEIGYLRGYYNGTMLVTAIRGKPMKDLRSLARSVGNQPLMESIIATDLAVKACSGIVDLAAVVGNEYEPRAQFEVSFGWCEIETFSGWDIIETVIYDDSAI